MSRSFISTHRGNNLSRLGWTSKHEQIFTEYAAQGWRPARIIRPGKTHHRIMDGHGERDAPISGRARNNGVRPALGDWAAWSEEGGIPLIHAVLPRHGVLSRRAPGVRTEQQFLAVNVDVAFLVQGRGGGRGFTPRGL